MAINPNIPLHGVGLDTATPLRQLGQDLRQNQLAQQEMALRDLQIVGQRYANLDAREKSRINSVTMMSAELLPILQSGDTSTALSRLKQRRKNLQEQVAQGLPVDTAETDRLIGMLESGDLQQASESLQNQVKFGQMLGILESPQASKLQEQLQTLQVLNQLPEEQRQQFQTLFGKGGTTVNVGGASDPFSEKFQEGMAKDLATEVGELRREAGDFISQTSSAEQALAILENNPDIQIDPTAKITTGVKEFFANYLPEDELKNIADYRQLESQLIRNRFDVTKVLKGAITEQEQQAAQQVAGSATGSRLGLVNTLKNNIAYSTLGADYRQRKAEYIRAKGPNYNPREFEKFYKELGEAGMRPTLDQLLPNKPSAASSEIPEDIRNILDKY